MKKLAIWIVLSAVIGLGIWGVLALRSGDDASQPQPNSSNQVTEPIDRAENLQSANTVTYTDDGFEPSTLTVKAGTTVTFKNASNHSMWVASDVHPSHQDLPEFDALTGMPPGATYSFTFTAKGTWGLHNHLRPSDSGTIVVE